MEIIKRGSYVTRWRVECPECLSILEGKEKEFSNKTSIGSSWWEFECPVCKRTRNVDDHSPRIQVIRYRINDDGSIGDEV